MTHQRKSLEEERRGRLTVKHDKLDGLFAVVPHDLLHLLVLRLENSFSIELSNRGNAAWPDRECNVVQLTGT